jgi:glutamate/tyrosine decarboxylase-like PLP-dependent enzyme
MGNRTLGCSRRADSLKLYLSWIYYGKSGFAARVKKAVANARGFSDELKNYNSPTGGRFKLVLRESQYTNVCFWYIPRTKLSKIDPSTIDSSKIESVPRELGEITRVIHSKLIARGRVMVDYMTVQNPEREELPYFFRMVFINPKVQMADYHLVLQEIDSIGSAIYYE